jgi:hypothetical protein
MIRNLILDRYAKLSLHKPDRTLDAPWLAALRFSLDRRLSRKRPRSAKASVPRGVGALSALRAALDAKQAIVAGIGQHHGLTPAGACVTLKEPI